MTLPSILRVSRHCAGREFHGDIHRFRNAMLYCENKEELRERMPLQAIRTYVTYVNV